MATTAPPATATDDDGGDHRDTNDINNNNTTTDAENSEGRAGTNTATTMAIQRLKNDKRSRRVSFAEMTSVHFFDRDEDNETPSDGSAAKSTKSDDGNGQGLGFRKSDESRDDEEGEVVNNGDEGSENDDDDDDDEAVVRRSFFRPIESPSPGSNIGSATSNDEDNFFGPVSASFIRPGRLSDSAASDENHDITMDSTAFSMHFRSLARSDLGLDLKTPTGVHLSFEEKTPTHTSLGSSMVLTVAKKPTCKSAVPVTDVSGGSDSSDMSLVGENSRRYDYERLSPELDELLAEGKRNLRVVLSSGTISTIKSPKIQESKFFQSTEQGNGLMELNVNQKRDSGILDDTQKPDSGILDDMLTDEVPDHKVDDANGAPRACSISHANDMLASSRLDMQPSNPSPDTSTWSPSQEKSVVNSKNSVEEPSKLYRPDEFSALSPGALQNLDDKVGQFDGFTQHKCESPFQDLRFFSPAKQKPSVMGSVSPSRYSLMVTPPQDQNIKHLRSESSIQKSISKLEKLQASAISSYLNAKINNSHMRSLELSKPLPFHSSLERTNDKLQNKQVSGSPVHKKRHPIIVSNKGGEHDTNIIDNGIEAPNFGQDIDLSEGSLNLVKAGTYHLEQLMKLMPGTGSLSQLTSPGKRRKDNQSASEDHPDKSVDTLGTDSTSAEIILDGTGERKVIHILPKFVSSPDKRSGTKSSSPDNQGSISRDLMHHDGHIKCLASSQSQDRASERSVVDTQLMSATAGNSSAFLCGSTEHVSSPVIEPNGAKVDNAFDGEDILHNQHDLFGSTEKFRTLLRHEESQVVHSLSLGGNPSSRASLSRSRSNFSRRESRTVIRDLNDSSLQKNLLECFEQSPSRKEPPEPKDDASIRSSVTEDLASLGSRRLMDNLINSSTRKRRNENDLLEDREHRGEDILIQRSPKLQKVGGPDAETLGCPSEVHGEAPTRGHDLEKWSDIHSKFLEDSERLLSPAFEKLNLHAIDVMDDTLGQLQRSKTYSMFCNGLLLQRTSDGPDFDHGRKLETRSLLHHIIYEKAKSQLLHIKRGKLQEKVQQLSSGLHEMQMLKSSLVKSKKCPTVALADAAALQSLSVRNKDGKEFSCNEVAAMMHSLEALERKISNLVKTLHMSCKIKGEHGYADTIALVNDHLKKRACCRFIRLDIQMWVVQDVESRNGHHSLILNYLGFIIQRLTVTVGPVSSIVVTNELNDADVSKKFPNMDACTAFGFVVNTKSTRKYVGVRSLAQETQVTSSLLSNLLDVVEEVQVAQIELQNLTRTSFYSQSAEHLGLQLCFFNFKCRRKLTLTLDVSCLKRGVYPSEAFPSELAAADDVNKISFPEQVVNEIRDAVKNLRAGYTRILRLCRCISHVVQASGG